jgi:hypothetical protein
VIRVLLGALLATVFLSLAFYWFEAGDGQAATTGRVSIAAASFGSRLSSTHNASPPFACGAHAPPTTLEEDGAEDRGEAQFRGSYLAPISLPDGATVTNVSFTAINPFSTAPQESHAFLLRKRTGDGVVYRGGLITMAHAEAALSPAPSSGTGTSEEFSDATIGGARVNNNNYVYYVELVICTHAISPIAVEVTFTTP